MLIPDAGGNKASLLKLIFLIVLSGYHCGTNKKLTIVNEEDSSLVNHEIFSTIFINNVESTDFLEIGKITVVITFIIASSKSSSVFGRIALALSGRKAIALNIALR